MFRSTNFRSGRAQVKRFSTRQTPLAAFLLALAALPAATVHATLTIGLQLAPGLAGAADTTDYIDPTKANTDIPIYVYATVTGQNAITPVPVPGSTATQPNTTSGDYDGIQFAYYNVTNTLSGASNGLIDTAAGHAPTLNTLGGTGFTANGSYPGLVQNVANGISVGSSNTTDPRQIAFARAGSPVFDNYFTFSAATQTYTEYGNDAAGDIYLSNNNHSASFLLETLYFKPSFTAATFTASTTTNKVSTTFSIAPVTFPAGSEYHDANWFEDQASQPTGGSAPTSTQNGAYSAGTSVSFVNTLLGDTNDDGKVDITDLGTVALNYGTSGTKTFSQGDFNNDGKVDITDLGTLALNYGESLAGNSASELTSFATAWASAQESVAAAAVPEPASLSLLAAGALLFIRRRQRD
jgi:hypothetical protein